MRDVAAVFFFLFSSSFLFIFYLESGMEISISQGQNFPLE